MPIEIERIEVVGVNVHDLPAARELFTRLFRLDFVSVVLNDTGPHHEDLNDPAVPTVEDPDSVIGGARPLALDPTGVFELIEVGGDKSNDSIRSIHFKVADIDKATAEMQANGIRVMHNIRTGALREVIFHPDDLFGVRINFVQYDGPSIIHAMQS